MTTMLYCIAHEKMVKATRIFDTLPIVHPDGVKDARVVEVGLQHFTNKHEAGEPPQYDTCNFPMGWATCPPPELWGESFEDWLENIGNYEPDVYELEEMNTYAEALFKELT